ncbi:MAG TPA: hypothetical protein VHT70_04435 [Candidatus Saccharimonadales bacterium]|jgi:hypothetical protein|nr:hypothetical protein [Candidatus Saccharimonadales bacterium]
MANFFVLGLVPGTNLQITFYLWLLGASGLCLLIIVRMMQRTHLLRNWIIAIQLFHLTRQSFPLA